MPVIFNHFKVQTHKLPLSKQQRSKQIYSPAIDYRSLRLLAGVWRPASQSACGRLAGHRLT